MQVGNQVQLFILTTLKNVEVLVDAHSKPCQTFKVELKAKNSILNVWQGSEYDNALADKI